MRNVTRAGIIAAIVATAGAADAQQGVRAGASYPVPGRQAMAPPMVAPMQAAPRGPLMRAPAMRTPAMRAPSMQTGQRWPMRDGRWTAGWTAPGGWNAYRRPNVGWALPPYWVQPGFALGDFGAYGLAQPPIGYRWSRYYDDAVLIDRRGSVYDRVDGIDWDRGGGDVYADVDDRGPPPPPPYRDDRRDGRRDTGLGGAAIGAVAGGVAGNVIAGRGNRLGGTLIGAGVGAAAGYAIDRAEDRGAEDRGAEDRRAEDRRAEDRRTRRGPPPGARYDDRHAHDGRGRGAGYPPPAHEHGYDRYGDRDGEHWVSHDGATTVTTSGGGYYRGGYPGGTTTTVTVQSAPVVTTTTTTEYYETAVTRTPRRAVHARRIWKRPGKSLCCR